MLVRVHGQAGRRPTALHHQLRPEERRLHDPLRPVADAVPVAAQAHATGAQAAVAQATQAAHAQAAHAQATDAHAARARAADARASRPALHPSVRRHRRTQDRGIRLNMPTTYQPVHRTSIYIYSVAL